jgi:capsular polysaccharide synthesis protein/methyltransferase family protein/polysaccharide pyruvyl transferase
LRKTIWTCWLQGQSHAPELVRKCLDSWQVRNPEWDFRCLDADTIARYVDVNAHIDLKKQMITAASFSDILRLLLLHEYGGVWVDATAYCNVPLNDWLPLAASTGFFAFARPSESREIASWFLAAQHGNTLIAKWTAAALAYWRGRESTQDYFWVHHQFGELCSIDQDAFRAWQNVPRISADGPHAVQHVGMYEDYDSAKAKIDWTVPVFKLTHRLERDRLSANCLISRLLGLTGETEPVEPPSRSDHVPDTRPPVGLLQVGTENLGDHIQILAGEVFLRRAGFEPSFLVDRDDGIAHPPPVKGEAGAGVLMNGWFKTNPAEWPPHPAYRPLYLGFHIRLFQSPSLVSPAALEHYATHGPIGCRDRYTLSLLRSHGVDAFLAHCLSLVFPRRLPDPERQTEVFVVSRDQRILDYLPASLGPFTFVTHYSGDRDFARNKARATEMLQTYRERAKVVVTTMLHCALPAIAMGIPVVVFFPADQGAAHESDKERFSSLSELVRVFHLTQASLVDWRGYSPDVSALKLKLVDAFFAMAVRWGHPAPPRVAGIAPSSVLPVPSADDSRNYLDDPERLERLTRAKSPDRQRWGVASSYRPDWAVRSAVAAGYISDGARVLEIGTGRGTLRQLVAGRCRYTGADLEPLDEDTLALDISADPVPPPGTWDIIVMIGVLEYLHDPHAVLGKMAAACDRLILSYCVPRGTDPETHRRTRGWTNALSERDLTDAATAAGLSLRACEDLNETDDFQQKVFVFDH